MAEKTYSLAELCDRFDIDRHQLDRAVSVGALKATRKAGRSLVTASDARRWLTERELSRLEAEWHQQDREQKRDLGPSR